MPTINVCSALYGGPAPAQGVNAIPPYVPAGSSATILPCQVSSTTAAFLQVGNSNAQPTGAQTYGSGFDGFPFLLRVAWKVTTKAACNVTIAIMQAGSSTTTYTSGNVVATTGAVSNGTGSFNGFMEAKIIWDSTSQKLQGSYGGVTGATSPALITAAVITNSVAVTTQAALGFEIAATFSDQTAGTTLTITEFTAEPL